MKIRHILFTLACFFVLIGATTLTAQDKTTGDATYYGNQFHGRRTSDGSIYHRDSMTCAHRTLPFGTLLKVTNMKNGREVVVKVTDRGPFRRGGIVDLSYAAAEEIDMIQAGVVKVEIEEVTSSALLAKRNDSKNLLPELQLLDPASGNYYTMTEWLKKGEEERAQAKTTEARKSRASYLANTKAKAPLWQVKGSSVTAKVEK
ncbi:MAG: septal ring lytic transglycosylase RlpA family protein [Bacteroidales bacterium]|nr:septal ring lytic transglycosylase RlpA family protein [Bacteroidales bacterium]